MKRSMFIDLIESCEDIDNFCLCEQYAPESSDILLEYDTSGKNMNAIKNAFVKSNAYNTTQTNITRYIKTISKLKSKENIDEAYEAELRKMNNATDKFLSAIHKLKDKKRDDEKNYEKENKFSGVDAKPLVISMATAGLGVIAAPLLVISIPAVIVSYFILLYGTLKQQDEIAFGNYMYLKWLKGNGKKVTNAFKAKVK